MAEEQNIHKVETPSSLYINRFWSGLFTNRCALFTPLTALGIQVIQRQDTLIGGANMQITPQFTLRRRYGFLRACSAAFGSTEIPQAFSSYEDLQGTVRDIVDTNLGVDFFSSGGRGQLAPKAVGAGQSSFLSVANTLYWCDGVDAFKFIGPQLIPNSNTLNGAPWSLSNATVAGGKADPFGGTNAWQLSLGNFAGSAFISTSGITPNYTLVGNNTFTFSVWAKQSGAGQILALQIAGNVSGLLTSQNFNLTATWTRYSVTVTMGASDSNVRGAIANGLVSGAESLFVYAPQLEVGAAVTPAQITLSQPQGVYLWGIQTPGVTPGLSFSAGSLSPTVGYEYVYVFRNGTTGHISTASAASPNSGPQASKNITVQGNGSTDPQVNFIDIYRTKDGGGVFYFNAEVANPGAGTWTFTDSTADSALNTLIIAPLAHVNDPPPAGASLVVWYAGRPWVGSENTGYFAGGPDTTNGSGNESFPPGNNFTIPGNMIGLTATSQGIVFQTKDQAYVTTGTNSGNFTVPNLWQKNFGVPSQNAVTQDGDTLIIYTARGRLFTFGANGLVEIGFGIAAQLAAMTRASVYVAVHADGADEGIFVSDGSANIYRYSQVSQSWDVVMQPVGGCGAIASIETTSNAWSLVMGRPTGSGFILGRDASGSTWTDDSSTFTCSAIIGSITVAPPGKTAKVSEILTQVTATGTYPTVSVMLNEIANLGSGAAQFTALPNPVADPPILPLSTSLLSKRHYFKAAQTPLPQQVQHLQIQISFPAEAFGGELLGIGVA